MNIVTRLQEELINCNIRKILYASEPKYLQYDKMYYRNYSFAVRLPQTNTVIPEDFIIIIEDASNIINIEIIKDTFYINKTFVSNNNCKKTLKNLISENRRYCIFLRLNDDNCFGDYVNAFSTINKSIKELRNEYLLIKYNDNNLSLEQEIEAIKKFPFALYVIPPNRH